MLSSLSVIGRSLVIDATLPEVEDDPELKSTSGIVSVRLGRDLRSIKYHLH